LTGLQEADDLRELVKCVLKRLDDVREVALIVSIYLVPFSRLGAADTLTLLQLSPLPKQGYSNGALTASMHPVLPAPLRTTHILISYPLGPRVLLTAFRTQTYQRALEDLVRQPASRVLLCQGDADDFTAAETYDAWAEALGQLATGSDDTSEGENGEEHQQGTGGDSEGEGWSSERGSNVLEVVRIPDASHFWGGQAMRALIEAVTQFLT
jgi:uncharacterized protein